jgi:hypothetical protein
MIEDIFFHLLLEKLKNKEKDIYDSIRYFCFFGGSKFFNQRSLKILGTWFLGRLDKLKLKNGKLLYQ